MAEDSQSQNTASEHLENQSPQETKNDLGAKYTDNGLENRTEGDEGLPLSNLPPKANQVTLRRKTYKDGSVQEENHDWLPYLADGVGKHCVGRDPMTIPPKVLTESGHPRRSTAKLVSAFAKGVGGIASAGKVSANIETFATMFACHASMGMVPRYAAAPPSTAHSGPIAWGKTRMTPGADVMLGLIHSPVVRAAAPASL